MVLCGFLTFQVQKNSFSASNLNNLTHFPKLLRKSAKSLQYKTKKLRNSELKSLLGSFWEPKGVPGNKYRLRAHERDGFELQYDDYFQPENFRDIPLFGSGLGARYLHLAPSFQVPRATPQEKWQVGK